MGLQLTIQVRKGGKILGNHVFDSDSHSTIKISKRPADPITINDDSVSRIHTRINLTHSGATLVDMGTTGGLRLNGARTKEAGLNKDDQILIGDTVLLVTGVATGAGHAAPADAPAPWAGTGTGTGTGAGTGAGTAGGLGIGSSAQLEALNAKLAQLPASTLAEIDGFVDVVMRRDGVEAAAERTESGRVRMPTNAADVAATVSLDPWSQEVGMPQAPQSQASAPGFGVAPQQQRPGTQIPREKYSTQYLIEDIQQNKKRNLFIFAGVGAAAVVVVILLVSLSPSAPPVGSTATKPPAVDEKNPPTPTDAGPAGSAEAEASPFLRYTLPSASSMQDLAKFLWGGDAHTELLLKHNDFVRSGDVVMPAGTNIKLPRLTSYEVVSGDTVGDIAERLLGEPELAEALREANTKALAGSTDLKPGSTLRVPLIHSALEKRLHAER